VDALRPGQDIVIDDSIVGWPARSLRDIPTGDYFVQALVNRYETFHRADGHTIKMPMDQGEGQRWAAKPGNLYSKPVKMHLDAATTGLVKISMDQEIPPIEPPRDTAQVKYLRVPNDRLTKFWGRPMQLGAIVLLPFGWSTHPNAHYPLVFITGTFRATWRPMAGARRRPSPASRRSSGRSRKPPTSSSRIGTDRTSRA
jgi:hypothetical protein